MKILSFWQDTAWAANEFALLRQIEQQVVSPSRRERQREKDREKERERGREKEREREKERGREREREKEIERMRQVLFLTRWVQELAILHEFGLVR